jgi:integrase
MPSAPKPLKPKPFPVYPAKGLKHGGGARIKIAGRSYYLGKHGSEASYREYERLRAEFALGTAMPRSPPTPGRTVDELIAAWILAEPRGQNHPQVERVCRACTPLSRLFGSTPAVEFRANRLRAVQEAMISQSWMTDAEREKCGPWTRRYINTSMQRILIIFRWGESTERLPMGITEHLRTVPPLKLSDRRVKDAPPREPVSWKEQVEPCMPHLAPVIQAMLIVQYHAALRPSEVCTMRRCEIDQSSVAGVWLYRPTSHKGQWRGHDLVKVLGPICQQALAPWLLSAEPDAFIFPPEKRRNGATRYLENGYAQAVRRAIAETGVKPSWCLYQLRHAAARAAEIAGGLAAAGAMLGHHSLETTKIYTDRQRLALAIEIAQKIG